MLITLQTAKERLAAAQKDVEFYTDLVRLLSDPRLADSANPAIGNVAKGTDLNYTFGEASTPLRSPHGEVRQKVLSILPLGGGKPMSTTGIKDALERSGYSFVSKHPIMAINDALGALREEGEVDKVQTIGVTNYWARKAKDQGTAEAVP